MKYDFTRLADVLDALYREFTGPAGDRNWPLIHQFFEANAKFIRTGVDEEGRSWTRHMSVEDYRREIGYALTKVGYYEYERERRVEQFGNVAHVWSIFENRAGEDGPVERRGINSIQLFRGSDRRWRIVSLMWDIEREGVTVPE